jgi:magnesium-transporting ATPase (P-type)
LVDLASLEKAKEAKKKKKAKMSDAVNSTEKIRTWTEHLIESDELAKQLGCIIKKNPSDTNYYGLEEGSAMLKQREFGPNALSEKKELPAIVKYLIHMTGIFNYMLWVGSILCAIA